MNKPAIKRSRAKTYAENPAQLKGKPLQRRKPKIKPSVFKLKHRLLILAVEIVCLAMIAVYVIMVLLGYFANWLTGTSLLNNLLPFAGAVLALVVVATGVLISWWKFRRWLSIKTPLLTPVLPIALALWIGWFGMHTPLSQTIGQFRTLVGGKYEVRRETLAHQVYAAYRRSDNALLQQMVTRAQPYHEAITEAAKAFGVDSNLLQGVAATESSFLPRDSFDGGHGLFQITQVPKHVQMTAQKRLAVTKLDVNDPRHNAFIAAATLKFYLQQMKNDLFLGLLAYNIGPANGGLHFIMQQYGATDFISIQPYLQTLPRDYPIRVLTFALAFRLWQQEGRLLAYEEGENARRIQAIGIPGLQIAM